jgi:hypothetical protein
MYFLKQDDIKILFLFFTIFSIILIIFNIYFSYEAFAMAPPQDIIEDYYGNKEYIGKDPYGYFHNPAKNISSSHELDSKPVYELEGKPVYKSINTSYDKDELFFWTTGMSLTGDRPTVYQFEPKHTIFELNTDSYQGTISTDVESVTWARRMDAYKEIIRDYSTYIDNIPQKGILSKISLCVKTMNEDIMCLYLKLNVIGKRKILWSIWERNRSKYDSYKQFKKHWDSNTCVWYIIENDVRNDIRAEFEDLLGIKRIKIDLKNSVRAEE